MAVALRPYQELAVESFNRFVADGKQRAAAILPTGTGKTVLGLEIARRFGKRTLWLAHRQELIDQPFEALKDVWPGSSVGIVKAGQNDKDAKDVVIASIQTVSRNKCARLKECGVFDFVVVDECFPPGTVVGGTPIERVAVGDLVPSFDENTGSFVERRVTRLFQSVPTALVVVRYQGGSLVSTWNHPIFTTRGWVAAFLLTCDDMVLRFTHEASPMLVVPGSDEAPTARPVLNVQEGPVGCAERSEGVDRGLLRVRQAAGVDSKAGDSGQTLRSGSLLGGVPGPCPEPALVGDRCQDEPEVRGGAYEDQEPDAPPGDPGEGLNQAQGYGMGTVGEGWQRSSDSGPSTPDLMHARLAYGGGGSDQAVQKLRLPDLLQTRRSERPAEAGNRDRRSLSRVSGASGAGSEEGRTPAWTRVDRVEVLEPGSDGTFGGLCPEGLVFNLEVEGTHTYIANGVVVHNCHHAVANSYVEVIEELGCMVKGGPIMLGLTATPNRDGLKGLFNQVIFDYPMRRAIEEGYLCPLGETKQIRVPGLDFSKIRTTKGDFVQAALGDAMLSTHVAEFTARGVKNLAAGRRTIVFTVLVEQAELTSKWLNDLGIKSAVVSGETPSAERKAILDKFYDGEIDVVCNASVLTEGYDNPRVDCIVVARPTKSPILYRQMLGRGFRPHPDKQNLLVIDLVDASNRFDLMGAAKFGREIANQGRVPAKSNGKGDGKGNDSRYKGLLNVEEGKRQDDEAEPRQLEFPALAEAPKPPVAINWISAQQTHKRNGWFASTNEGVVCVFKAKISYETEWIVAVGGNRSRNQFHRLVGRFSSDKFAFGAGADAVRKMAGGKVFATNLYPNWRAGAATDEQTRLLRSLGQPVPKTKGEAADSITVSLGVQYGREIATMMRDKSQGRPAPWLKDYQPLGAGR